MSVLDQNDGVQCPFYRSDDGCSRICCEGILDDSNIILSYRRRQDQAIQRKVFCCRHYTKCEIYGVLAAKYADD